MQRPLVQNSFLMETLPIVSDYKNLKDLAVDKYSNGFTLGNPVTDGSWRIVVSGGGGDAMETKFIIQHRSFDAWVDKSILETE